MTTTNEEMAKILFSVAKTDGVAAFAAKSGTIASAYEAMLCYTTEWAAFVNGANTHLSELDDTHRSTAAHAGLGLFATALAMAERTRLTGKEPITAVVAGCREVALSRRYVSSCQTTTCAAGTRRARRRCSDVAVAAKLLKLDEERGRRGPRPGRGSGRRKPRNT